MENVSPEKVGERIRAVRGKQTQTEFANVLGVKKQNYISRYERGRIPSPDLLVRIAEIGRVTTDWLLTGKRGGARGTALSQQIVKAAKKIKVAVKTATKQKTKTKPKAVAKPKSKAKAKKSTKTKVTAKPKAKIKAKIKTKVKAKIKTKTKPKAKAVAIEKPIVKSGGKKRVRAKK